jgi:ABC-type glycerol-3-phosphate transport system substrate-binding protein
VHPSALELVSHAGRQYGVAYTYYHVGFYYRRDVLAGAGSRKRRAPLPISSPRAIA